MNVYVLPKFGEKYFIFSSCFGINVSMIIRNYRSYSNSLKDLSEEAVRVNQYSKKIQKKHHI